MDSDVTAYEMRHTIVDCLDQIERQEDADILYACESGSRAWGFESTDSDWDVRFIFARPRDAYLAIDPPVEQIERQLPDKKLDIVGWDIRKTLRLLRKSNPSLIEWLHSPIRYREQGKAAELRRLVAAAYNPATAAHHYASMARSNEHGLLDEDTNEVILKRYFYVLRAVLALRWAVDGRGIPPVAFYGTCRCVRAVHVPGVRRDHMFARTKAIGCGVGTWPTIAALASVPRRRDVEDVDGARGCS